MNGYEVLARALQSCADRIYAVPGYPVTGLSHVTGAEPVTGEKVALEYAFGDSLSGRRAAVIMKNAGLNACADPLIQATSQGLRSGVVIVAGDDPEAEGSTTTQDSRYYGEIAQIPVLEPGAETCSESVEVAFSASERFSRVTLLRATPALLFSPAEQRDVARINRSGTLAPADLTMRGRAARSAELFNEMFAWSCDHPLNRFSGGVAGIGAAHGDSQVVTVYPPPRNLASCKDIREIGRPFVREHSIIQPPGPAAVPETIWERGYYRTFCQGCPFLPVFEILHARRMTVVPDAGCSILVLNPPYRLGIANYGLGTAIGVAARSTGVALIGDYGLISSGIPSLIDVYEKKIPLLCIVLNNRCMGMTGGQEVPDPARYISWADPVTVGSSDREALGRLLVPPVDPVTVIVEGQCPEGRNHETIAC
ncbi:MAG TPA: thiamine pyrophosphate-dependent enzyme [Methanoregulaceae archaeon]|nr:MAG: indolepyruvate ferredoxin oxidoreductase [Methanolinea sp.]HON81074.1 thiamine pyrophosphate-dependent enzyme [Methanoregulaceae archaeon]HPD10273.1 thiamine pyrophosphate-dependent enzyme [Methanoregulaceae archaeon]HRT14661.1 thiamine pyrophosphate-dependent enzyme [Methanoregulaceae archaeon]HRU30231.1 thiamine pyrophosphate-dependent enzyme [Methanoregulaceae archaeon]